MNKLKSIGILYFIVRDTGSSKDPVFSTGFMRQTGFPWKSGKGIQLRIGKYVSQIGLCRPNKALQDEQDGLLYAMQGRLLDEKPNEIGNW